MDLVEAGVLGKRPPNHGTRGTLRTVVIPSENEDLDLTHWWVIRDDGAEILYVGTPETFAGYVRERNGGVQ